MRVETKQFTRNCEWKPPPNAHSRKEEVFVKTGSLTVFKYLLVHVVLGALGVVDDGLVVAEDIEAEAAGRGVSVVQHAGEEL